MTGIPKARVYIDGFNLYKGALEGTPHKWLDLAAWADRLLPGHEVTRVVYCTASVASPEDDPTMHLRQHVYWRALRTRPRIAIRKGQFKVNPTRMLRLPQDGCACCSAEPPGCKCCRAKTVPVLKREEKGSDVQLAVELVHDGLLGMFDTALVVSGDADLQPAIDIVRGLGGVRVIVADPRNRKHPPLVGDERRILRTAAFAECQLPSPVSLPGGSPVYRPESWG
jgi:uncharacterized LabA/DUF88 family protein